jgi:DNA repair protein RecN (Recombination protein N)
MLTRLFVRDFVIVTRQELEIRPGFTALTGETGAGKSILVDALSLLLGERSSADVIRPGAQQAEISAEFDPPPAARRWLADNGFGDEELLLRRTIDAQGKSRAYINGSPATVAQLRSLGESLVDIFGQHAHQRLMRADGARGFLDEFADADTRACEQAYAAWREARQALDRAAAMRDTIEQQRERLGFELGELDRLAPGEQEWDELSAAHQRMSHAAELIETVQRALDQLDEGDDALSSRLGALAQALATAARLDASLNEPLATLRDAEALLADAGHALRGYLGKLEVDPAALAQLDERMSLWMSLARRHRTAPRELAALVSSKRAQLAALDAQQDLDALQAQCDRCLDAYRQAAAQVTRKRRSAAPRLAAQVTESLQALGMPGAKLVVELTPLDEPAPQGMESVEFLISGHPGTPPRPVAKVASGGELSRIALAIAVAGSRKAGVPTLVFDEIDAGIGGATAQAVGRMLRALAERAQVLCVTHLAQVAASAHHQFRVSKHSTGQRTESRVEPLPQQAREEEIARMLGMPSQDEKAARSALALARQLLQTRVDS